MLVYAKVYSFEEKNRFFSDVDFRKQILKRQQKLYHWQPVYLKEITI